ncbi:MAG: hypothetical protein IJ150_10660 [Bacteroidales bacterium]|nr:hypothetical protein [Bacteroidales bacterium]
MKSRNFSYYVAALMLAAGMSTSFVSCVDETEEPDYVKQVREAEMKAEIAEKEKEAKEAGKESEAAFTDAFLNQTLQNTPAYSELLTAKVELEQAETTLKQFETQINTPENLEKKAKEIADFEPQLVTAKDNLKTAKENKSQYNGDDASMIATYNKNIAYAEAALAKIEAEKAMYENNSFLPVYCYDCSTYKDYYETYLYLKDVYDKKKANYDEKKAIYDKAIEGMQKANN